MEAARLPMIYFDGKISPDKTEFTSILLNLITTHFEEDSSGYTKECHELDQLRVAVCSAPLDFTGCGTLKRYYCQLCFLLNRFPFLVGVKIDGLDFTWEDVYEGSSYTHSEVEFEKAAAMYNIGAIHSYLACQDNRSTADGMKISCTHLQCAAWAFQQVRDSFNSSYCSDWTYDILSFQEQLMLAQSQECILEKSMADNRKSSITAKVAWQCAEFYKKALSHLESSKAGDEFGSSQVKKWKKHMELKLNFTRCVTYYYLTLQSEDMQQHGERVAYAQAAAEKLAECHKLSQNMSEEVKTAVQFINDVVAGKLTAAKKENDFIYHAKIPSLDSLPDIKGAALVKGIGFEVSDKSVSGADIFSKLVPIEAHEASSLYSEEKAKLLRDVGGRIEEHDVTLTQYLASLQIDPERLLPEFDNIPDVLVEKCAAISIRPETMKELTSAMHALAGISVDVETDIRSTEDMLLEETDEEAEFQEKFGKRRILVMFEEIRAELDKCKQAFTRASQSNIELHKAMNLHIQNLKLLASPLDDIKTALPNPNTALASEEIAVVSRVKELFSKINEMRSQRTSLYSQLRDQVLADDITKSIVTRSSDDTQALFAEQLKKHSTLTDQIEMYLMAQPKILDALTKANINFVPVRQKIDLALHQRDAKIEELVYSYDAYKDLLDKQQRGMEFYQKLQHNVEKVKEKTAGLCSAQKKERAVIAEKLKPKGPPPARPTANKPGMPGYQPPADSASITGEEKPQPQNKKSSGPPKLKDYLPFMKAGGNAASAITSVTDVDLFDDMDDLDDAELPDFDTPATPKLKDYLPFMTKGGKPDIPNMGGGGAALPPDLAGLPAAALKYLPKNMGGAMPNNGAQHFPTNQPPAHRMPVYQPAGPVNPGHPSQGDPSQGHMPGPAGFINRSMRPAGPMHQQITPGGRMPPMNQNPSAGHMAHGGFIPHGGFMPMRSQMAPGGQIAPGVPMAPRGQMAPGGQMDPRGQMAPGGQIAPGGQLPHRGQVLPAGQLPHGGTPPVSHSQNLPQRPPNTTQAGLANQPGLYPQQPSHAPFQPSGVSAAGTGQLPFNVQTTMHTQQMTHTLPTSGHNPNQASAYRPPFNNMQHPSQTSQGMHPGTPLNSHQSVSIAPSNGQPQSTVPPNNQMPGISTNANHPASSNTMVHGSPSMTVSGGASPMGPQTHMNPAGQSQRNFGGHFNSVSQAGMGGQQHSVQQDTPGVPTSQQHQTQNTHSNVPNMSQHNQFPHSSFPNQTGAPNIQTTYAHHMPSSTQSSTARPGQPMSQRTNSQHNSHLSAGRQQPQQPQQQPQQPQQTQQPRNTGPQNVQHSQNTMGPSFINHPQSHNTHPPHMGVFPPQPPQTNIRAHHAAMGQPGPGTLQNPSQVQPSSTANPTQMKPHTMNQSSQQPLQQPGLLQGQQQFRPLHPGNQPQQQLPQNVRPQQPNRIHSPAHIVQQPYNLLDSVTGSPSAQPLQPFSLTPQNSGRASPASSVHSEKPRSLDQPLQPPVPTSQQQHQHPQQRQQQHPQQHPQKHPQQHSQHPQQHSQQQPPQHPQHQQQQIHSSNMAAAPTPQSPSQPQQMAQNLPNHTMVNSNQQMIQGHHPQPTVVQQQNPNYPAVSQNTSLPPQTQFQPTGSKDGVRNWLQHQNGNPQSNQQSIPVVAVSPQPKVAKSHVDDFMGVSIMPTSVPHDYESKIDWSQATITPQPTSKSDTKPVNLTNISAERDNTPAVSRQTSRGDHRDPYSDEQSLDQFVHAVERYVKQIETLTKPSLKGPTPLDKEWQEMCDEQERENKRHSTAAGLSESTRNRHQDILPYDRYRVMLKDQKNDYINASVIDNLPQGCPVFIAAQGPLNQTEADFWTMIMQQKIEYVVMLSRWSEQDHSESARYWPRDRNDRLSFGNLLITLHLTNNHKYWIERRINITNLATKETHLCTQLEFTSWPLPGSNSLPEPMPLLLLVNEVTALHKKQRSVTTPIIVHCGNGISKTGVFLTLYNAVLAVNSGQGIVSVGRTVGLLRQRRRGLVSTQKEYLFCHTALLYYAQDILVKRGILTSQASFSKPLAQPGMKSHGRTPSNDFIMSDTSLALLGELSLTSTTTNQKKGPVSSTNENKGSSSPANQRKGSESTLTNGSGVPSSIIQSGQGQTQQNIKISDSAPLTSQLSKQQELSRPADSLLTAPTHQSQPQGASEPESTSTTAVLDISDPQTFELGQGRQRITKADFFDPNAGIKKSVKQSDDPFSGLDPMWSLGVGKK